MTKQDHTSRRIATGLSRIAVALRGLAWKGATEHAVTPTQAEILQQLADAKSLRLGEVAERLSISAPTASDAVSSLVSKGLASKVQGADKRSLAIKLTAAGRDMARRAGDWPELLAQAAESLSPDEQAAMLRGLSKIIARLQDEGAISAQRLCLTCQHFRPFAHQDAEKPHHCALIDRAYGDGGLQINCADHEVAAADLRTVNYGAFGI
jgi:DNA-binding MarR family transcriptional regulator